MPSSMTHTYFGIDVKNKLPKNCQNKINLEYFKLFCQGSDPFMFYHFLIGKKAKEKQKIQNTMHLTKTKEFFINIIKTIQKYNLENNPEVMSYLYGYICHYYLDLNEHPFIKYNEELYKINNKNKKYNGIHQELEYSIDLYLIKKNEDISPHKYKVYNHIFNIKTFTNELKKVIDESIKKTYNYNNISKTYLTCIHYMKAFFKYINHDPTGIKLLIYKTIDKLTPINTIKLEELSYHHNYMKNIPYLNLEHKPWKSPYNDKEKYTTSFLDLYEKAKKEAIKTITTVTEMLEKKQLNQKILDNLFQNLSYLTGKPCN